MAKIAFQRVAIVGTGLIGASLGLALKRLSPAPIVSGFDISGASRRSANSKKAVDRISGNLAEATRDADLVIIATPVRAIELLFQELAPLLKPGAVVTDTASTKRQVLLWAEAHLPKGVSFIGGHPMTGRSTVGASDPSADLFPNAVYCVTPLPSADGKDVEKIVKMVEAIGSVAYFVAADEHDGLVASISHLPFLLSIAMMRSAATDRGWREAKTIAAGGFATSTALVDSDPRMFADICLTNQEQVARQIDRLVGELTSLRNAIEQGDESLYDTFSDTQVQRLEWLSGRGADEPPPLNTEDLKPSNLFFGSRLGGLFSRGEKEKR